MPGFQCVIERSPRVDKLIAMEVDCSLHDGPASCMHRVLTLHEGRVWDTPVHNDYPRCPHCPEIVGKKAITI